MSWGLALSGGAFKGSFQVPVFEGLIAEHGWPSWIGGVSIGAGNGAVLASKEIERPREVWDSIDKVRDAQSGQVDFWNGIYKLKRYRQILGWAGAGDTVIDCSVGMVDLMTGRYESVDLLPLAFDDKLDAVVASGSQPFVHEKAKFKGRWKVDGGLRSIVPRIPRGRAFDTVRVVQLHPWNTPLKPSVEPDVDSSFEQLGRSMDILLHSVRISDERRLRRLARKCRVEVYAPPSWESIGKPFEHSPELRESRYALGEWALNHPIIL